MILSFNREIASKYGVREALLIQHIDHWLAHNVSHNNNYHKEEYWMYDTKKTFHDKFNCFSEDQVKRTLESLEKQSILKSDNFNKVKFDRTKWYTFTQEFMIWCLENHVELEYILRLIRCKKEVPHYAPVPNGTCTSAQPIPHIQPHEEKDTTDCANLTYPLRKSTIYFTGNSSDEEITSSKSSEILFNDKSIENIKDIEPLNNIIEHWNKYNCFSSHKKRSTKLYRTCNIYCKKLLDGTFLEDYKIDKEWRLNNNLNTSPLKQLTEMDLKTAIFNYSLQFEDEYKPTDKSRLPKSFTQFVYNPKTQKSQLLWLLNKEPLLIDEPDLQIFKNRIPKETLRLVDKLLKTNYSNISDKNLLQVYVNTSNTLKHMETIIVTMLKYQKNKTAFITQIGKKDKYKPFIEKWIDYLYRKQKLKTQDFSPEGFTFTNFVEHLSVEYSVDLDISEYHLKKLESKKKVKKKVKNRETSDTSGNMDNFIDDIISNI